MNDLPPPRPIRFHHRGAIVSVSDAPLTRSVLDWLRVDARCTGTKEGCNEGDCGACTVIVAELADRAEAIGTASAHAAVVGGLLLRTVNACIQWLPTLDGKALLTVEDLAGIADAAAGAGGTLHPVQRALVDCHGSQCGFCTPGFAVSLAACYERHAEAGTRPTRPGLADELSGNLCRCTGYRPILDAGERMFELPAARLQTAPIVAALERLRADAPLHYAAPPPATHGPGDPPRPHRFHAPRSVDALASLLQAMPESVLLSGCTDIGLWVNKQFRVLPDLIYLGAVDELRRIGWSEADAVADGRAAARGEEAASVAPARDRPRLRIGAAAPLEDAWRALVDVAPGLSDLWRRFASPPVRHAGTMGGNVANGSPIGDSAPALLALDATLCLRLGTRRRTLPLADFYLGYMLNRLEPGEFIEAIELPRPSPATQVRGYKLAKRFDCDISAVCAACSIALDDAGTAVHVRLAFGGMAAIVRRAAAAEAAIAGQPWTERTVRCAMDALARDFQPLDDLRASAAYRLRAAQNLLMKFWLETRREDALAGHLASVWHP